MTQIQRIKQTRFGHSILLFGVYLKFGIWNLEFEINRWGHFAGYLGGSGDIRMNSISAGVLRTIHRIIGGFDEPLQVEVVPVLREADADRDVMRFGLLDGRTDAFRNRHGPIRGGSDQEDGKFVPSVAITRIDVGPDGVLDDVADCLQDLIPFQMAVEIIVLLEIVEIEHQERERGFLTF